MFYSQVEGENVHKDTDYQEPGHDNRCQEDEHLMLRWGKITVFSNLETLKAAQSHPQF